MDQSALHSHYFLRFAMAAWISRSLVLPVLSRIALSDDSGPNPETGLGGFLFFCIAVLQINLAILSHDDGRLTLVAS